MTIQAIVSNTIKRLKAEGKQLTPDFYAEAFCKEASKAKMSIGDCSHVEKYKLMLNKEFQKDLKNYNIKTMNEFIRFIVAKLNRTNPSKAVENLEAQTLLTKKILQVVEILHNKEAAELAKNSIEILNTGANADLLDTYRQRWSNFLTAYDDTFLLALKKFGAVEEKDLQKTIENLTISKDAGGDIHEDLQRVSKLLISSFVPSIASSVNDTIAHVSEKIGKNPKVLDNKDIDKEIKNAISLRIALDKESVKEMVESIDGILDKLSLRLIDMIEKSDSSSEEIQFIKKELESYSVTSETNFKAAHKKLYTIATALDENTQVLIQDLKSHSGEVNAMSKKIQKLESELEEIKKESKEDFLTKLYNRRALDELLAMKEGEFKRYERNFSIIMFDLDKFKDVNDTFGHEAGDAVLFAFAKILKKECRSVDIVGRYGGEEFIAFLSETDIAGGAVFAEKVRIHVQKARLMYKGKRINVTVSSGVSERKQHISLDATLHSADEYLYEAKSKGRNRVEYKK